MKTIPIFFEQSVKRFPENIYLQEKTGAIYSGITYKQTKELVYRFAAGLMTLGIRKGDRVALISEGRIAWVVSELGILYNGAINVPLSVKLTEPDEIKFRLAHSGARFVIASGIQAGKIRAVRKDLPEIEHLIVLDDTDNLEKGDLLYSTLIEAGDVFYSNNESFFHQTWNSVSPDDVANICYTSGTTADPKGIMLTHGNYMANVEQAYSLMEIHEYFRILLLLPWDHAFAHTAGIYCFMGKGASVASVQVGKTPMETLRNLPLNLREIKPTVLLSVPAIANNFKKNIEKNIREKGRIVEKLFKHALKISRLYNGNGWKKGLGCSVIFKPLLKVYDLLIFRKIREGFGNCLEFFVGGGALLDIELQHFFYAIGIPMFQGYGLTEASPIISSNSISKHKLGSSGYLVVPMDLKICDENGIDLLSGEKGEITIRGGNVMLGYWKNKEATDAVLKNGWLHTGDLGYMDEDGFLYVLGRYKSLLIADDGEKYSPEGIEEAIIGQSLYIEQCMLYNNQNSYTVILIVPNVMALKKYLAEKGVDFFSPEAQRVALNIIEEELQEYRSNGRFANMFPLRWLPAAIGILDEGFSEENHLLNTTLKMVRGKISEKYQERLEFLYTPGGKDMMNQKNLETMKKLLG